MPTLTPVRFGSSPEGTPKRPLIPGHAAAPAPPTPPFTGLGAWYDASVFSSLAFTGPDVTGVADLLGNGNNLFPTPGSITPLPTYDSTGFNGLPTLDFIGQNGPDSVFFLSPLSFSPFTMGDGSELTFWFVGTADSAQIGFSRGLSYTAPAASHDYDNVNSWAFFRNNANPDIGIIRNNQLEVPTTTFDVPHIWIGTVKSDGSMKMYVDGIGSGPVVQAGNWITGGTLGFGGGTVDFDTTWKGKISEAGIVAAFNDAAAVNIGYLSLKAKWGL